MEKKIVLSIAGSDPSGGAGIQNDLKTIATLGLHGVSVTTCITIQNTEHVFKIYKIPISIIENQIDVLLEDLKIKSIKIGMLYDAEIVKLISKKIKKINLKNVVDPVMNATSGDSLSKKNFLDSIKKEIFPHTYILTPNIHEAQSFSNMKIESLRDMKEACKLLYDLGPKYVLITGGHLSDFYAKDVLFNGKDYYVFSLPKIPNKKAHGSGCTLSSLIAGFIALDEKPFDAIEKAKNICWNMIYNGYKIGKGADVINNSMEFVINTPYSFQSLNHFTTWFELKKSVDNLISIIPSKYIPEVGLNFGYAIPDAKTHNDICAIEGRIFRFQKEIPHYIKIYYGSSRHIASIILASMRFNPEFRCALNLKYSEKLVKQSFKAGFIIDSFDRKLEPSSSLSTLDWGTKEVIMRLNKIPDVIYDSGALGKEAMIRILAENPKKILNKLRRLLGKGKYH